MKVYILMDCPSYDPSRIVAVYADYEKAKLRMEKMEKLKSDWVARQNKLEEEGSDDAWASCAPHYYDDLCIESHIVRGQQTTEQTEEG